MELNEEIKELLSVNKTLKEFMELEKKHIEELQKINDKLNSLDNRISELEKFKDSNEIKKMMSEVALIKDNMGDLKTEGDVINFIKKTVENNSSDLTKVLKSMKNKEKKEADIEKKSKDETQKEKKKELVKEASKKE